MRNKKKKFNENNVKTLDVLDKSIDGVHNNQIREGFVNSLYLLDNSTITSLFNKYGCSVKYVMKFWSFLFRCSILFNTHYISIVLLLFNGRDSAQYIYYNQLSSPNICQSISDYIHSKFLCF